MVEIMLLLLLVIPMTILIFGITFWACLELYEEINSTWEKIHRKNYCVRCGKNIPKHEKYCSKCYIEKFYIDGVKK